MAPVAEGVSAFTIGFGRLAILVTCLAWITYSIPTIANEFRNGAFSVSSFLETLLYVSMVSLLGLSATVYLFARHGALTRGRRHRRAPRALLTTAVESRMGETMTTLIPSYREEVDVVLQTLLSAALQEYPSKRVVLLIDDPPIPDSAGNATRLREAQDLPGQVAAMLEEPARRFQDTLERFDRIGQTGPEAIRHCAETYQLAISYVSEMRHSFVVNDNASRFTRDQVLGTLERDLDETYRALIEAAEAGAEATKTELHRIYRRLVWTFSCEITSFQRKRYINLSHEANKAMNLNSYIGLMGSAYKEVGTEGRNLALQECEEHEADIVIPHSDFILTLDADSVLLPEYCLRLTNRLGQPGFEDVAVIQTPYSSYPGAASRMERISGATTDIQHILHQGMTYYDATFWVGANAILRREALDDIEEIDNSGPWPVKRYISDNTVIEDTESSIDLVSKGWRLHNYNERLSYSATPPDFGSLCIQRERWANGGLLILPKLRFCIRRDADFIGILLRLNYMASIAWSSFALALMLFAPFDDRLLSPLVVVMALPYFAAMAGDLKRLGFKRTDVVRIYAFNLLMLPVNFMGSLKSIYQAVSGGKYSFARTPKVKSRTTAAFLYVTVPYLLIAWSSWTVYRDITSQAYGHAVFAGLNAAMAAYGLVAFIGIGNSLVDMGTRTLEALKTDVKQPVPEKAAVQTQSWEETLFYGDRGSRGDRQTQLPPSLAHARPEFFAPPEEQAASERQADDLRRAVRVAIPDAELTDEQQEAAAEHVRQALAAWMEEEHTSSADENQQAEKPATKSRHKAKAKAKVSTAADGTESTKR